MAVRPTYVTSSTATLALAGRTAACTSSTDRRRGVVPLARHPGRLARAARVMEVGCGAGWMWAEASARLPMDLELRSPTCPRAWYRGGRPGRHARALPAHGGPGGRRPGAAVPGAAFDVVVANYVLTTCPTPGGRWPRWPGSCGRTAWPWWPASETGTSPSSTRSAARSSARTGATPSPSTFGARSGARLLAVPLRPDRVAALSDGSKVAAIRRAPAGAFVRLVLLGSRCSRSSPGRRRPSLTSSRRRAGLCWGGATGACRVSAQGDNSYHRPSMVTLCVRIGHLRARAYFLAVNCPCRYVPTEALRRSTRRCRVCGRGGGRAR